MLFRGKARVENYQIEQQCVTVEGAEQRSHREIPGKILGFLKSRSVMRLSVCSSVLAQGAEVEIDYSTCFPTGGTPFSPPSCLLSQDKLQFSKSFFASDPDPLGLLFEVVVPPRGERSVRCPASTSA
ncbi:hypothetical protein E5288_WYG020863 [Bos mutus]|uniref:Uncharacterized protein n=1 Tax=Bos mutus TaxID=72004 RepID=A0A6B0R2N6_9CETA|nr:hypothetical protein [Bos mutus]